MGTLIPYVMAFNAAERIEKLAETARALGADQGESDPAALARAAVRAVADLLAAVGIPRTLADLGVPADRLADMARDADERPAPRGEQPAAAG